MHIARDLTVAVPGPCSYIAIGVFDGVHRGHQLLITEMVAAAHASGCVAAIYTFDPHPLTVLGREAPPLLTTVEQRAEIMSALGLDILVVPRFTLATVRTRAPEFAAGLVQHLHMVELWAGPDFALGYQREGDIAFLGRLGAEQGFRVRVVEPSECEGARVSSSRIRVALQAGDIPWATSCLGRSYQLVGTVVGPGRRDLGIGWHTAMAAFLPNQLMPGSGVYACLAHIGRTGPYPAVAYVRLPIPGLAPHIEVGALDVAGELRDQKLTLDFVARLRDEDRLSDGETLITRAREDADRAHALLGVCR